MDTAGGLELQMLTGAGIDKTINYLQSLNTEFALRGAQLIETNRDNFFDFVEAFETYFGYRVAV